jgi:DNA ligase (NAD+)
MLDPEILEQSNFKPSNIGTHLEELAFLEKNGFPINPYNQIASTLIEVWQIQNQLNHNRDDLIYNIDGLVVKLNDNELAVKLDVVGKTPRGWCAIKFAPDEITTKIVGLIWQVGKAGKVTPVADLEPVELMGTIVKRASLHNYKEVVEKDLRYGDTVVVRKAGDIIPEVVQVLSNLRQDSQKPLFIPKSCPSCSTELILSSTDVDLVCPNTSSCPAQTLGRLSYFCQRNIANITGLSEKNLQKFMQEFGIQDIADLYDLPFEKILEMEGYGQKSVENLHTSIQSARTLPDYKFLAGLSIDGVGPEVAKLICQLLVEYSKDQADER